MAAHTVLSWELRVLRWLLGMLRSLSGMLRGMLRGMLPALKTLSLRLLTLVATLARVRLLRGRRWSSRVLCMLCGRLPSSVVSLMM